MQSVYGRWELCTTVNYCRIALYDLPVGDASSNSVKWFDIGNLKNLVRKPCTNYVRQQDYNAMTTTNILIPTNHSSFIHSLPMPSARFLEANTNIFYSVYIIIIIMIVLLGQGIRTFHVIHGFGMIVHWKVSGPFAIVGPIVTPRLGANIVINNVDAIFYAFLSPNQKRQMMNTTKNA
jgi:hypothetical protein